MAVIRIVSGLPYVTVSVRANDKGITLSNVLLDTGSASTLFKTDVMRDIGVTIEEGDKDPLRNIRGVGGREWVVEKPVDAVILDDMIVTPFIIEMGAMAYGFPMDGIIGVDFLMAVKAQIDFDTLEVRKSER